MGRHRDIAGSKRAGEEHQPSLLRKRAALLMAVAAGQIEDLPV